MDESSVTGGVTVGAETVSVEEQEIIDPKNFIYR
jgi:hypothetical protein